jgi:hypothetical protein
MTTTTPLPSFLPLPWLDHYHPTSLASTLTWITLHDVAMAVDLVISSSSESPSTLKQYQE